MELDYKCPRVVSAGGILAVACTNTQEDPHYALVGGKQPHHVLHGNFCCQKCHRKFERPELALLQQMRQQGKTPLSEPQLMRLQELEQRVVAKRASTNLAREKLVAEIGIDGVRKHELCKSRAHQSKNTERRANDPDYLEDTKQRSRAKEANRLEGGGDKKKHGLHRKIKGDYPLPFMRMLTQAARIWAIEYGQEKVWWNHLVPLFDLLLVREKDKLNLYVPFLPGGQPKYSDDAYRLAAKEVPLVQCEKPQTSHWYFPDYGVVNSSEMGRPAPKLRIKVIKLLDQWLLENPEIV